MTVIIGIDPHKASHTAVAIGCDERQLAEIKVRATSRQTAQLLAWAEPLGERTWAAESAALGSSLPTKAFGVSGVRLITGKRPFATGRWTTRSPPPTRSSGTLL
jgi:hypothetical protein